uniref:ADP-ribosylhydrolase ARH3 n=1 Tax=Strigamia maritima TaxID=126957 RepID=T1IQS5_STRMM
MAVTVSLRKKFQGSLIGCLIGDCLGERFESAELPVLLSVSKVANFFEALQRGEKEQGSLPYTDDTAMTKELAKSIIDNKSINNQDLAKRLTQLYYAEPDRGYGTHVGQVFHTLKRMRNLGDVLKPAKDQFQGTGSYGNGAAMRATPVGLFFHKDLDVLIEAARDSSLVTHAHCNGYNGAILQAMAVRQALLTDPSDSINPLEFVQELRKQMEKVEKNGNPHFTHQLKKIEMLLSEPEMPDKQRVVDDLGNDVSALNSVPTAIFAYLVSGKQLKGIDTDNLFERTIHYAISLGGDTDTIACMAGGICGAHLGIDAIPKHLITPCETHEQIVELADQLLTAL